MQDSVAVKEESGSTDLSVSEPPIVYPWLPANTPVPLQEGPEALSRVPCRFKVTSPTAADFGCPSRRRIHIPEGVELDSAAMGSAAGVLGSGADTEFAAGLGRCLREDTAPPLAAAALRLGATGGGLTLAGRLATSTLFFGGTPIARSSASAPRAPKQATPTTTATVRPRFDGLDARWLAWPSGTPVLLESGLCEPSTNWSTSFDTLAR